MIPHPTTILARLREGSLLPSEIVAGLDHDAILDARDGDPTNVKRHTQGCHDLGVFDKVVLIPVSRSTRTSKPGGTNVTTRWRNAGRISQ